MFSILINQLLYKRYAPYNLKHLVEIILMVPSFKENIALQDMGKFPFIIEKGEQEARQHIPYLKKLFWD